MINMKKPSSFNTVWTGIVSFIFFLCTHHAIAAPAEDNPLLKDVVLTKHGELTATFADKRVAIFRYEDPNKKQDFFNEIIFTNLENTEMLGFRIKLGADDLLFPGPDAYMDASQLPSDAVTYQHLPSAIWSIMEAFARSTAKKQKELFEKLAFRNLLNHEESSEEEDDDDEDEDDSAIKNKERKTVDLDDLVKNDLLPEYLVEKQDNEEYLKLVSVTAKAGSDDTIEIKADDKLFHQTFKATKGLLAENYPDEDIEISTLTVPVTTPEEEQSPFNYLLSKLEIALGFSLTPEPTLNVVLDPKNYDLFKQDLPTGVFIPIIAIINRLPEDKTKEQLELLTVTEAKRFVNKVTEFHEIARELLPTRTEDGVSHKKKDESEEVEETPPSKKTKSSKGRSSKKIVAAE
ncbi:hypothetical protein [Endozoicomonas sp. Mp262]|uniref:hypothetical protein n=1 Tax=Endozoicomonas sp. Mp262 TaxID=2919499 RepID=UPI0021D9DFFB